MSESAWKELLQQRHVEVTPDVIKTLEESKIDTNNHANFGFVSWWNFLVNNDMDLPRFCPH